MNTTEGSVEVLRQYAKKIFVKNYQVAEKKNNK